MADRTLLWSTFGGRWHQVRVRYPRARGRFGQDAVSLAVGAVGRFVAGFVLLYIRGQEPVGLDGERADGVFPTLFLLAGLYLTARGVYRLVRVAFDQSSPVTMTGEVLWDQVCRMKRESNDEDAETVPWLYYLAVDDGDTDGSGRPATIAWGAPSELGDRYHVGDVVRLTARPWSRRVLDLAVVEKSRSRQLPVETADDSTEQLIAEAMGGAKTGQRQPR